jgi:hypothetical protein
MRGRKIGAWVDPFVAAASGAGREVISADSGGIGDAVAGCWIRRGSAQSGGLFRSTEIAMGNLVGNAAL